MTYIPLRATQPRAIARVKFVPVILFVILALAAQFPAWGQFDSASVLGTIRTRMAQRYLRRLSSC